MSLSLAQLQQILYSLQLQHSLRGHNQCVALYSGIEIVNTNTTPLDHNESSFNYDSFFPSNLSSEKSSFHERQQLETSKNAKYHDALSEYYALRCTPSNPCNGECEVIGRAQDPSIILERELEELKDAQNRAEHKNPGSTEFHSKIDRYNGMLERLNEVQIHRDNPYLGLYNSFLVCLNNINKMITPLSIRLDNKFLSQEDRDKLNNTCQPLLLQKSQIEDYLDHVVKLVKIYRESIN